MSGLFSIVLTSYALTPYTAGAQHEGTAKEMKMQAVAFTQTGAPEVLRVLEVPDPTPGPGQVRIQVKVSGVNFRDIGVRRDGTNEGSRTPQPVVTGIEAAGVVESLGAGVTHLRVGQRVATICQGGGYGGLLVVPAVRAWFGVFNAYG